MSMDITIEQRESATVVRIAGSVDGITAEALLNALQSELDAGNVHLVGDISGVAYTSSAGLRSLLATVKQARSAGGDFRLAGAVPAVHRVLELSGFTTILKMFGDVDEAVASFSA
ncbi:MAG: STAS domain-containing protein [Gemmatimonadaceae bacterium]